MSAITRRRQILQPAGSGAACSRTFAFDACVLVGRGSLAETTPALKKAVNKRGQRGTLGQDQQSAEEKEKNHYRRQPPPLALAQEREKLSDNGQLIHSTRVRETISKVKGLLCLGAPREGQFMTAFVVQALACLARPSPRPPANRLKPGLQTPS